MIQFDYCHIFQLGWNNQDILQNDINEDVSKNIVLIWIFVHLKFPCFVDILVDHQKNRDPKKRFQATLPTLDGQDLLEVVAAEALKRLSELPQAIGKRFGREILENFTKI